METIRIEPAFQTNNIPIIFSTDANYLYPLAAAVQSVISNASIKYRYDICILYSSLDGISIEKFLTMRQRNVSIRFFHVDSLIGKEKAQSLGGDARFPKEAYYRLFIPEIFSAYDKILYMDCDVIVTKDISDIYNVQLGADQYLGAIHDTFVVYSQYKGDSFYREKLKLRHPENYFQSGVLLMNLRAFRESDLISRMHKTAHEYKNKLRYPDQDILNMTCEGHIKYLDGRWNVEYLMPPDYPNVMPRKEAMEFEHYYRDPWCIHFCGRRKPWGSPVYPLSHLFWKYARMTPFYEDMVYKNIYENITREFKGARMTNTTYIEMRALYMHQIDRISEIIKDIILLPNYKRMLRQISWNVRFSWGKRRERYIRQRAELQRKILETEDRLHNAKL